MKAGRPDPEAGLKRRRHDRPHRVNQPTLFSQRHTDFFLIKVDEYSVNFHPFSSDLPGLALKSLDPRSPRTPDLGRPAARLPKN